VGDAACGEESLSLEDQRITAGEAMSAMKSTASDAPDWKKALHPRASSPIAFTPSRKSLFLRNKRVKKHI